MPTVIPKFVKRYGELLSGKKLTPLFQELARVQHLPGEHPLVNAAKTEYAREGHKVLGARAGTAVAAGGAAYGVHRSQQDPSIGERFRQAAMRSRVGKLMGRLGVKESQFLDTERQRRMAHANLLALFGSSAPALASHMAFNGFPEEPGDPQLIGQMMEAAEHKGHIRSQAFLEGDQYQFNPQSRMVSAPKGFHLQTGQVAHELGHAQDKVIKALGHNYVGLMHVLGQYGPAAGVLGAVSMPDEQSSKQIAAMGTAATAPMLAHELYASARGAKLLRQSVKKVPMKAVLRAFQGLPTYGAVAAAPLTAYAIRKHMGGFNG